MIVNAARFYSLLNFIIEIALRSGRMPAVGAIAGPNVPEEQQDPRCLSSKTPIDATIRERDRLVAHPGLNRFVSHQQGIQTELEKAAVALIAMASKLLWL